MPDRLLVHSPSQEALSTLCTSPWWGKPSPPTNGTTYWILETAVLHRSGSTGEGRGRGVSLAKGARGREVKRGRVDGLGADAMWEGKRKRAVIVSLA